MEYKNYNYNKSEVLRMFNHHENVIEAIIGAINGIDDQQWLEEVCIKYISNEDFGIARTAIYGVSSIARIYGRLLNKDIIYGLLNDVLDQKLKSVTQEVFDDLEIFLKRNNDM